MPHEVFCSSFFKFQIGANWFRIKFCIRLSNSFLSKNWGWYPEKQPNLKIVIEIKKKQQKNKKKRPLVIVATKLGSAGTKLFALKHAQQLCWSNRLCQILIPTFQRVTTPLFLAKNWQNRAKSNHIFREILRWDGAFILRYLDSPMAIFCPGKYLVFSISATFME